MKQLPRPSDLRPLLAPSVRRLVGSVMHVQTQQPVLALTFDDGPNPEVTPELLRLFAKYNARATFFALGNAIERWPGIAHDVVRAGHVIANHTWDHPSLLRINTAQRLGQIFRAEAALRGARRGVATKGPRLFRPPYGEQNARACLLLKTLGFHTIGWNVDCGDWHRADTFAMREELRGAVRPGNFFLFHDAIHVAEDQQIGTTLEYRPQVDRHAMISTVAWMLETYSSHYRFVTVPEAMAVGTPVRRAWLTREARGAY